MLWILEWTIGYPFFHFVVIFENLTFEYLKFAEHSNDVEQSIEHHDIWFNFVKNSAHISFQVKVRFTNYEIITKLSALIHTLLLFIWWRRNIRENKMFIL